MSRIDNRDPITRGDCTTAFASHVGFIAMTTPDSELTEVERTSLELSDRRLRVAVAEYVRVTDGISDRA